MRKLNIVLFVIGVVALLALLSAGPMTARSAELGSRSTKLGRPEAVQRPPVPAIQSRSDESLGKLSPDLLALAKSDQEEVVNVTVLLAADAPTAPVRRLMQQSAVSKPVGEFRWVTGVIKSTALGKLAAASGLVGVASTETFKPAIAPGLEALRQLPATPPVEVLREALLSGGKEAVGQALEAFRPEPARQRPTSKDQLPANTQSVKVVDIHDVKAAHDKGYTGAGVTVAVVDSGVDFGHPDLQGRQARLSGGPYDGWPFAYDTLSGVNYVAGEMSFGPDNWAVVWGATWYVHTLPVDGAVCAGGTCSADLIVDYGSLSGWPWDPAELTFTWPDTSKSHTYYYSTHPDPFLTGAASRDYLSLGYGADFVPPALIVADEAVAGKYDTVYVDVDFNQDLTSEVPMRRGAELAGADLYDAAGQDGQDGVWDLSASMLTWIADGTNPPPGVGSLYEDVAVPEAGRLLAFVGDSETHGTNVAGMIAGQSVITDPEWVGAINPLYAGASAVGGAGGPVAAGMAPDAVIAAMEHGWYYPLDAWVAAVIGFDGAPQSGDEAQLVNNSWGSSDIYNDGWDFTSRFGQYLNHTAAPASTQLVATGNGGPGYGTTAQPNGAAFVGVGASTSYGTLIYTGFIAPEQFTHGSIISWSNRGPGAQESVDPELVCVGAYGSGLNPLNASLRLDANEDVFATGQGAYDIFGGTSMATPVCAGVGALIYDAYKATNGEWPTYAMARELLMGGATDLGYDGLTQGAGNANADRATGIIDGDAAHVSPVQWQVGDYRGEVYEGYAAIAGAGESYQQTLTVHNPTGKAVKVKLSDTTLSLNHEESFEVTLPPFVEENYAGQPTWLDDITSLVREHDPDLLVAQVMFPLDDLDPQGDYDADSIANAVFIDWTDRNGDGNLWTDTNGNGSVDIDEIDRDANGIEEEAIVNDDMGAVSNNHQVSVGRDSLSRRHDGVFLGLYGPFNPDSELTVKVSLRFYEKTDWNWLSLNPASVSVPAGGNRTVSATMDVPRNARPGIYQGSVEALGQVIPVVVQVAAEGTSFDFGATAPDQPLGNQPYDNNHVSGLIDWGWRPETGDQRFFYYDVADGTAEPGKSIVIDTRWPTAQTDVDTRLFGAEPDDFSESLPDFFGPNTQAEVGGSANMWIGGGQWLFETATGGPHEVVSVPLRDGLGTIALHNVLNGGQAFGDAVVGSAYTVMATPFPAAVTATRVPGSSPLMARAEWAVTFSSERRIEEGLEVLALGVGRVRDYPNQTARQDDPDDICSASYVTPLQVGEGGGAVRVTTTSTVPGLDIDLFLIGDDGDGVFDCAKDPLVGGSGTPEAEEAIEAKLLPAGKYHVLVLGWSVPGGEAPFDLMMQVIDGKDLTVQDLPTGPVEANTPVEFKVLVNTPYVPGTHDALLYLGPKGAPLAMGIPVAVTIPPAADAFRAFAPIARR